MKLDRVPRPTIRFVAVAETTTDRVAGFVVGMLIYLISLFGTLAVLIAIFGMPGTAR